jgi:endonuclease YncB( thermonuclease family)
MARETLILIAGVLAALLVVGAISTAADRRAESQPTILGPARVIDGDTLQVGERRIRLYGIDAPEMAQICRDHADLPWRCGEAAAMALESLTEGRVVLCEDRGLDRFGRTLGICGTREIADIGGWLVGAGWAVAYEGRARVYRGEEQAAEGAKRGLWGGSFQRPAEWRAGRRG